LAQFQLERNGDREFGSYSAPSFDGALYASADLALLLEDLSALRKDYLYTVGDREIECEVFRLRAYLAAPLSRRRFLKLGAIEAMVPTRAEDLSDVAIVGRKILNSLVIRLDGKKLDVL